MTGDGPVAPRPASRERPGPVAVVTDSAADLPPVVAAGAGIRVVPLDVSFGDERFKAGVELTTEELWRRMSARDAPFPRTAAASPGEFRAAFEAAFDDGARGVVCVTVGERLSATIASARVARDMLPGREIHVVDSRSASLGEGLLALLAVEEAARGRGVREIAATVERRTADVVVFVALDTLEYLRRGGRISPAQAAIGTLLSIKPIVTIVDGTVDTADRVRTRGKARQRVVELLSAAPAEALGVLFSPPADPYPFRDEVLTRLPGGLDDAHVLVGPIGASVGPHVGPGCLGGVVLRAPGETSVLDRNRSAT